MPAKEVAGLVSAYAGLEYLRRSAPDFKCRSQRSSEAVVQK